MKNFFRKMIALVAIAAIAITIPTSAMARDTDGPSFFKKAVGSIEVLFNNAAYQLGGSGQEIDKIWVNDIEINGVCTGTGCGGGAGAVTTVFTRAGDVIAAIGDYIASQITNTPAGTIAATDAQSAINELDTEKMAIATYDPAGRAEQVALFNDMQVTGVLGASATTALSINGGNATLYDIASTNYFVQGVRYSYAGETGRAGCFAVSQSACYVGLDASGLVEQTANFSDTELLTITSLGRLQAVVGQSGAGSTIQRTRDDRLVLSNAITDRLIYSRDASGAVYSHDSGSGLITENAGTPFTLDQAAAVYYDFQGKQHTLASDTTIDGFILDSFTPLTADSPLIVPAQFDDGSALVNLDTDRWATHSLFRSVNPSGSYFLKISTAQYVTREDAKKQQFDFGAFINAEVIPVAKIVVKEGEAGIDTILDQRPVIGRDQDAGVSDGVSNMDVFGNASSIDPPTATVTESGGIVTYNLSRTGGDDFRFQFNGINYSLDTDPSPATTALAVGSDTAPTTNYVYVTESGGVLTLADNTTGFPDGAAKIAEVDVQSATGVQNDGVYRHHQWDNDLGNGNGGWDVATTWIRSQPATYVDGIAPTTSITVNGGAIDNVDLAVTSGNVRQVRPHATPVIDTGVSDPVFVVNDSTTAYDRILDLSDIDTDSTGATLRANNTYYSLVAFIVASENTSDSKIYINSPSCFYASSLGVVDDINKCSNFTIPASFTGSGLIVARINLRYQTVDSGTITEVSTEDCNQGQCAVSTGGGGSVAGSEFSDNLARIFNVLDNTKKIAFDASAITTATTRTLTAPDASGTIQLVGDTAASTSALDSATTTINVDSSAAPSSGDLLTATSSTTATWQTPAGGGVTWGDTLDGTAQTVAGLSFTTIPTNVADPAIEITGFGNVNSVGLKVLNLHGKAIEINESATNAVSTNYGIYGGTGYNTNSNAWTTAFRWTNENNVGIGQNAVISITGKSSDFTPLDLNNGAEILVGKFGTSPAFYAFNGANITLSNGLFRSELNNTQTGASVLYYGKLGTSTQAHTGLLIEAKGANTSQKGIKVDKSSFGTGIPIQVIGSGNEAIQVDIGQDHGMKISGAWGSNISGGINIIPVLSAATINKNMINVNMTQAGTLGNHGAAITIYSADRSHTGATTISDIYNIGFFKKRSRIGNASAVFNSSGGVLHAENDIVFSSGTMNDTSPTLSLVQDNLSLGGHILFNTYSGAPTTDGTLWFDGTDLKIRAGGTTYTLTKT